MSIFRKIATLVFAITAVSTLAAESRCPGNVASLPFRIANRHQMIVPVSINHQGPFAFLLDTGTQITMINPELAAALHLAKESAATVASPSNTFCTPWQCWPCFCRLIARSGLLIFNPSCTHATSCTPPPLASVRISTRLVSGPRGSVTPLLRQRPAHQANPWSSRASHAVRRRVRRAAIFMAPPWVRRPM